MALTLDVDLEPNMHVYAPGVEGYIPIDWKMEDSGAAQVLAPAFPRAEKLYLKAIDETVPAYRNHFRLLRDITIKPDRGWLRALHGGWIAALSGLRRSGVLHPADAELQWTFEYRRSINSD